MGGGEFNPYRAPEARPADQPALIPPPPGEEAEAARFALLGLRSKVTQGLLVLGIVLGLGAIAAYYLQIRLLGREAAGEVITEDEGALNEVRVAGITLLQFVVRILLAASWLLWSYRARWNLPALGVHRMRFSPTWILGGWFFPVLNLIRPYQVLAEVWAASGPEGEEASRIEGIGARGPAIVGWWWGLYVLYSLASGITGAATSSQGDRQTTETLANLSWAMIGTEVLGIIVCLLALQVVRGITARQEARYRGLVALAEPGGVPLDAPSA